jgi:AraC-like DNA-binding protein
MKKLVLLLFLFSSVPVHAQNEVLSIDTLSFRYVYMEFRGGYDMMESRWQMFWKECQRQDLWPDITDHCHSMYLSERDSIWRLAFPIRSGRLVQEPLRIDEIHDCQVVRKRHGGADNRLVIRLLNYRLQEMGLYQSNWTMIRWFGPPNEKEIIIPVRSIDSVDNIIGRVSGFMVSFSMVFYLLLALFFLLHKKGSRPSNIIFAFFLISCAMLYIDWIVGYFRYTVFVHFPHILYIGEAFRFVIAPLLFFYTLSVLQSNLRFKKWYLLHLLPFVVVLSLWTIRFYQYPADVKRTLFLSGHLFSDTENSIGSILFNAQVIGYLLAAIVTVHIYKKEMKHQQSSILPRQYSWLNIVLYGFLIMNYLGLLKHFVYDYFGVFSHMLFTSQILSYFVLPLVMLYYGLRHPELFSLINLKIPRTQIPILSEKVFNDYKTALLRCMEEQKPYLIPDLNINKLSELVEIPVRSLSEVINKGFHQNFFEFINTYRIAEAKELMAGSHRNKTILEVVYEVGYNNKSVFNAVFKKYTGKTPKEYRTEALS